MESKSFEGIGNVQSGSYDRLNIEGVCQLSGDVTANEVHIEGVLNAKGNIVANTLYCEGVGNFKGSIHCKKANVEGVLNIKGAKVEAERIDCEGAIKSDAEILADEIYIYGCIKAKEICGDKVKIESHPEHKLYVVWKGFWKRLSKVNMIEATEIEISGVEAENVNGEHIVIGMGCKIENVDCDGTLRIHPEAQVRHITGNAVVENWNRAL